MWPILKKKIQESGFSAYPDGSPSHLIRLNWVLLYGKKRSRCVSLSSMCEWRTRGQMEICGCMWVVPLWYGNVDSRTDGKQWTQLFVKTEYHRCSSVIRAFGQTVCGPRYEHTTPKTKPLRCDVRIRHVFTISYRAIYPGFLFIKYKWDFWVPQQNIYFQEE